VIRAPFKIDWLMRHNEGHNFDLSKVVPKA
jgi:hypothetical protein